MNVSLTPELEQLVGDKVRTGMYQTASEVVREALRLLKQRDEWKLEQLRRELRGGFEQIEQGDYTEHTSGSVQGLARDIKRQGRRRLTAKRTKTRT